jgi:hypothetical protein
MIGRKRFGVAALLAAAVALAGGISAVAGEGANSVGGSGGGDTSSTYDPGSYYRQFGNDAYYIGDYYKNLGYKEPEKPAAAGSTAPTATAPASESATGASSNASNGGRGKSASNSGAKQ